MGSGDGGGGLGCEDGRSVSFFRSAGCRTGVQSALKAFGRMAERVWSCGVSDNRRANVTNMSTFFAIINFIIYGRIS